MLILLDFIYIVVYIIVGECIRYCNSCGYCGGVARDAQHVGWLWGGMVVGVRLGMSVIIVDRIYSKFIVSL